MINGLEGIPGSGKSYEAVVFHVLQSLQRGRKVITNLPLNVEAFTAIDPAYGDLLEIRTKCLPVLGTWDADRVPAFQLFGPGEVERENRLVLANGQVQPARSVQRKLFGNVWDFYSTWKAEDGSGPLFVIDECHVGLPKIGTDSQVVEWYKLHRHFNVDVLLCTQKFRAVCSDVSDLLAMLIKVRKADVLGIKNAYIRNVYSGYRGALISTDQRKYQSQFFTLYKSHTQGNSVSESSASDVTPFLVKFKRLTYALYVVTAVAVWWAFWGNSSPTKKVDDVIVSSGSRVVVGMPSRVASAPVIPASSAAEVAAAVVAKEDADMEPFKKNGVHLTGWMRGEKFSVFTFTVSQAGMRLFDLTRAELEKSGYTFEPLGKCAGVLHFESKTHIVKTRLVICDAPAEASGKNNYPVVMDSASGKSSRDGLPGK